MRVEDVIDVLRPATRPYGGLSAFVPPEYDVTSEEAREKLEECEALMRACAGDEYEYMKEAGYAAYWTCMIDILNAAEKVGRDNLPNVQIPVIETGLFLDLAIKDIHYFGREVLMKASYTPA